MHVPSVRVLQELSALSEDEEHRSTFWQDVAQNEHVVRLMLSMNRDVHACIIIILKDLFNQ